MSEQHDWPAFAGIDWGGAHHQLCIVDSTGKRRTQLQVTHDVAGLTALDGELHRCGSRLPIAIERSEGLLVEHLQAAGHVLFPVSPRIAARARERYKVAAVKTTDSMRSCSLTRCAMSISIGGHCRSPRRCSPRSAH